MLKLEFKSIFFKYLIDCINFISEDEVLLIILVINVMKKIKYFLLFVQIEINIKNN